MKNWMKANPSKVFNLFVIVVAVGYLVYLLSEAVISIAPEIVPHWFQIAATIVYTLIAIGVALAEIDRRATEEANEAYFRDNSRSNNKTKSK